VYITTQVTFTITYTDDDGEFPTSIKWREDTGATQNLTMTETTPGDTDVTDGKDYAVSLYLGHGAHDYDFAATDGVDWYIGQAGSITVQNRAPVISNGPGADPAAYRNTAWNYDFDATDDDTDTIGWEMSGPAWLTIIPGSGYMSGTTPDAPGVYSFTVWANDSYTGSDSYAFSLHVNNRVPEITSSGNTTQEVGTFLSYHITATDGDSDTLTYELSTNATWASISGAWVNGTATGIGWYAFTVWANDSYGGSDSEYWQLTADPNLPPYFTSTPIYTVQNQSAYSYHAEATDPEANPITFALDSNCSELSVDPDTGMVTGTPILVGSYWLNVTASDGINPPAYQNFTLQVTEIPPEDPTGPTGPIQISAGVVLLGAILAAVMVLVWKR
jgi:hypothetical protein